MNLLYPSIPGRQISRMLGMTLENIHNSSYIGGVIGTTVGCLYMARMRKRRAAEMLA